MAAQLVEVFVGGVQRGGTTTLYSYLAKHRQLVPGEAKELHFFDDESLDWHTPDYARLHARFSATSFWRGIGRYRFDATPIYLFWPGALERIERYNPRARHIFVFRDPIERAWSSWRMICRAGLETLPFEQAIRVGRDRLAREASPGPAWRYFSYVERGFYAAQLKRAYAILGRDRVLLLRSQDLYARPVEELAKIAAFLNLRPFIPGPPIHENGGGENEGRLHADDVAYLAQLYREDALEFGALSGLRVDDWLTFRHAFGGPRLPSRAA